MKKGFFTFLFFLFLFFLLAGYWIWQKNSFSKEVVKLEILGPESIGVGEKFEYLVKFKNNGNLRLEDPRLIFEYPEQAILPEGTSRRVEIGVEELGEAIYPGEERTFSFEARLLGKIDEAVEARATLSFRPKNLKAYYESFTTLTTIIKSVPLTFDFDFPPKAESGKKIILNVNYFSNIDYPLSNVVIKMEYPVDFEILRASPESLEMEEWEIPVLNKGQGGRIEIEGKLEGKIGETKFFKGRIGVFKDGRFLILKEINKGIEIVRPLVYIRQEINGNPQYVALPGEWLHYEVFLKNIGQEPLTEVFMVCQLEGEAFDYETLKSDSGYVRPGSNIVVFDWKDIPELQYIDITEEAKLDFWVKLKEDLKGIENPALKNIILVKGIKEEFLTKVSSKIELVQRGFYYDEVFGNSGPLPPEVGKTTTYTIVWEIKNYYSTIKEAKVKAVLPENVELTGRIFPEKETSKFSFDPESREVVWSIGEVERGVGVEKPSLSLAFQVAFMPDKSQKGKTPLLIGEAEISGEDVWTEKIISATSSPLDTRLATDPQVSEELGIVQ